MRVSRRPSELTIAVRLDLSLRFVPTARHSREVRGEDRWTVDTPFGPCVLAAMDPERRVLFANRHLCTEVNAETGEAETLGEPFLGSGRPSWQLFYLRSA